MSSLSLSLLILSLPLCLTLLPRPPLSFPPSPPVLTFSEFLCRFPLRRVQEKWQKRTMKSRLEVNCTSCSLPCDKNVCMNRWEQAVCSTSILPPPPPHFLPPSLSVIQGYHPHLSTRPDYKRTGQPVNITNFVKTSPTEINEVTIFWAPDFMLPQVYTYTRNAHTHILPCACHPTS